MRVQWLILQQLQTDSSVQSDYTGKVHAAAEPGGDQTPAPQPADILAEIDGKTPLSKDYVHLILGT